MGDSVDFLRRKYTLIEDGILVTPSTRHIKAVVAKFQKYNDGRSVRLAKTPCHPALFQKDESDSLDDAKASAFRSLIGLALYISHDRWDVSFCAKSLASYLKQPTVLAWKALARLVGYVASTPSLSLLLKKSSTGNNPFDAFASGKSTSCAIHFVNGNAIYFTSRSQKVASLSSTESEWYSACSSVSDALFIKYCCEFFDV